MYTALGKVASTPDRGGSHSKEGLEDVMDSALDRALCRMALLHGTCRAVQAYRGNVPWEYSIPLSSVVALLRWRGPA